MCVPFSYCTQVNDEQIPAFVFMTKITFSEDFYSALFALPSYSLCLSFQPIFSVLQIRKTTQPSALQNHHIQKTSFKR